MCKEVVNGGEKREGFRYLTDFGITYTVTVRDKPRAIRWHHVSIDLLNPDIQLGAVVTDDPDGAGPAEARLESPVEMARDVASLVLINANHFAALPNRDGGSQLWTEQQPVRIVGLAGERGIPRSDHHRRYTPLWLDNQGRLHISEPENPGDVRDGVAGSRHILKNGRITRRQDYALHPRTGIGFGKKRRFLHLVVADGRQEGFSEGVTTRELAEWMQAAGCHEAINLDGGGSSVMVLSRTDGFQKIVNSPSTKVLGISIPRPIPVAFYVRRRPVAANSPDD